MRFCWCALTAFPVYSLRPIAALLVPMLMLHQPGQTNIFVQYFWGEMFSLASLKCCPSQASYADCIDLENTEVAVCSNAARWHTFPQDRVLQGPAVNREPLNGSHPVTETGREQIMEGHRLIMMGPLICEHRRTMLTMQLVMKMTDKLTVNKAAIGHLFTDRLNTSRLEELLQVVAAELQ